MLKQKKWDNSKKLLLEWQQDLQAKQIKQRIDSEGKNLEHDIVFGKYSKNGNLNQISGSRTSKNSGAHKTIFYKRQNNHTRKQSLNCDYE